MTTDRTFDKAAYVEQLKTMMARHPDPELHSAIWSYREGAFTERELWSNPAFSAAMKADTRRMQAELASRGVTPEVLREKLIAGLTAEGLYPPAPGEPDIVAEVDPSGG